MGDLPAWLARTHEGRGVNRAPLRDRYLNDPQSVPMRERPHGRPALSMPMPPPWATTLPRYADAHMSNQHLLNAPPNPSMPNIPMGPGGITGQNYGIRSPDSGPPLHVRPQGDGPGSYANFADYANQANRLPAPLLEAPPVAPQARTGIFGRRRGLEPPNAPGGPNTALAENVAAIEAIRRARLQGGGDPTGLRQAARDELAAIQQERLRSMRNANRGG